MPAMKAELNMSTDNPPVFNIPPLTKIIIIALITVHVSLLLLDEKLVGAIYGNLAFRPLFFMEAFSEARLQPLALEFLSLTSHMFLHFDWLHLAMNAGMLMAFGSLVERTLGGWKFAGIFVLSGWMGAFAELLITDIGTDPYMYGASAGVFGMMGAAAILLLPKMGLKGVAGFVGVLLGINLLIGATPLGGLLVGPSASIAWAAHFGGFIAGFILCLVMRPKNAHE